MLLDTSINHDMQPFKMLGDYGKRSQKGLAYSIQSVLCNAGSVVGYVARSCWRGSSAIPRLRRGACDGYMGVLSRCVHIAAAVRGVHLCQGQEMPPHEYAAFHGISGG